VAKGNAGFEKKVKGEERKVMNTSKMKIKLRMPYYLLEGNRIKEKMFNMAESVLQKKTYEFSLRLLSYTAILKGNHVDYSLVDQLTRSGTGIGALVREAEFAQSRADFINKLSIALKEANETVYWLNLIRETNVGRIQEPAIQLQMVSEIKGLLIASIKTAKRNQNR
jgi:four helix bundle protein